MCSVTRRRSSDLLPIREDTDRLIVYIEREHGPMVYWWPRRTYIGVVMKQWVKIEGPYVTIEVSNGVGQYIVEEVDGEHSVLLCNLIRYEPLNPAV